jgi:subtilisin family serine protease
MISISYTKTVMFALIHIFASFFIFQMNCNATPGLRSQVVESELIIQFEKKVSEETIETLVNNLGASIKEKVNALDYYILTLPSHISVDQAVSYFIGQKLVKAVEPNYLLPIQAVPNDPLLQRQWALKDTGVAVSELKGIEMIKAWDLNQGFSGVVIAVIDTGVDYNHEDLSANIWQNPGEIPGNGIDDDQNGYIDDIIGWDFVDAHRGAVGEDFAIPDNDPMDSHGHGTHVAGIAAAVGNNGLGIAGVAWNCKIMPLRAGYKTIKGGMMVASHHAARAIIYAADNGAHIINLSWAGKHKSILVERAIAYAAESGVLVCAAGGNKNTSDPSYPAAFDNAAIISVGSVDRHGKKAFSSNYGDWLDVSAPGVAIYSTYPNNQYRYMSGTSMATPVVSGIAALIWSLNPDQTNLQVKDLILNSVDYLESLIGKVFTGGRVNANNALIHAMGSK